MLRLRSLLPLAAVLVVGSCRDSISPPTSATGIGAVRGPAAASVFTPLTDVIGVNSAGTSVRQGNGPFVIRTPFGGADENTSSSIFGNVDEAGTIFGWSSTFAVYYRKVGGEKVEVALPIAGEQRLSPWPVVGRTLDGGEVVLAAMVFQAGVEPANEGVKLYRWSSGGGWQLVGTSLSVASPAAYQPRPLGITADGAVAWARFDPNGNRQRLYRTALNGNVTFYLVPDGHTDGSQNVANNNGSPGWTALRYDGSLVGYSFGNGTKYPIIWAPDGTPAILPNPGGANYDAHVINGSYIVGNTNSVGHETPVRWEWNGSSWDFMMFGNDRGSSAGRVHVNSTGMIAAEWTGASPAGFTYGRVSDQVAFRAANIFFDDAFIYVDASNRFWTRDGYFSPTVELFAPTTLNAAVGVRMNLPLRALDVLSRFPLDWEVRWQWGVNGQIQEGVTHNNGPIPLVRHIYTQPGTWTARAIVADGFGNADTTFTTVTVYGADQSPTASVTTDASVAEGTDLVFSALASTDPNSLPLTYVWRFDGVGAYPGGMLVRQNVARGVHTYRLIATNSIGLADTTSGTVTVTNAAPTGRFVSPAAPVLEGNSFTLSAKGVTDAPGDEISVGFDCGLGSYTYGSARSIVCDGLPDQGTYTVKLKLIDQGTGDFNEYTATVTARNKAPVVTITGVLNPGVDEYRLEYSVSDVSGDLPLTVTFQVNGERRGGTQLSPPSGTSVKLKATYGDVLTVRVRDKDGTLGTASFTIPF